MSSQTSRRTSLALAGMAGIALTVASVGSAFAISGGGYQTGKQGCSKTGDANSKEEQKQNPHCHDMQVVVSDGKGHTFLVLGTETTSEGHNVHAADLTVSPSGTASTRHRSTGTYLKLHADDNWQPIPEGQCGLFDLLTYPVDVLTGGGCNLDPTKWKLPSKLPTVTKQMKVGKNIVVAPDATGVQVYFGADDGLDTGEHDEPDGKHGTKKEQIGPSDGGAIVLNWHPNAAGKWLPLAIAGIEHGKVRKIATNPVPIVNTGFGACADGICFATDTKQTTAYKGGGKTGKKQRDAYNYDGKKWDPYNCSGESPQAEQQCHDKTHKDEDAYYRREAKHVHLQPGVQIYEDPDANGSPLAPTYPLPGIYAGSCGVALGGGPLKMPASPITNKSGQLMLTPTHC